jgi:hypothetical protein
MEECMKTLTTLAGLSLIAATPALADPKPPVPANAPAGKADASEKTRYCVMTQPTTGSLITRKVCQTRADWLRDGFDPLTRK